MGIGILDCLLRATVSWGKGFSLVVMMIRRKPRPADSGWWALTNVCGGRLLAWVGFVPTTLVGFLPLKHDRMAEGCSRRLVAAPFCLALPFCPLRFSAILRPISTGRFEISP